MAYRTKHRCGAMARGALPAVAGLLAVGVAHGLSDASVLLQESARSIAGGRETPQCDVRKSLIIALDGTNQRRKGTLWKLVTNLEEGLMQRTHYEPGITDIDYGRGVRVRALRSYLFLANNYCAGDSIYIIGQSRGCLSARYLQGVLHAYGLHDPATLAASVPSPTGEPMDGPWRPPPNQGVNTEEDLRWWEDGDGDKIEAMFENVPSVKGKTVEVHTLTCLDGPLRTLWEKRTIHESERTGPLPGHLEDRNLAGWHLQIASSVRHFFHALSLEELPDIIQAAELLVDNSTQQEQVWFMNDHGFLCSKNDIAQSWVRDKLIGQGVFFKPLDVSGMDFRFCNGESPTKAPTAIPKVRDIHMCRRELYGDRPVKVHQSVKDRMDLHKLWAPYTECCYPGALEKGVEWVSNPTYEQNKRGDPMPQWYVITVTLSLPESLMKKRMLILQSDAGDLSVDLDRGKLDSKLVKLAMPYTEDFYDRPKIMLLQGPCGRMDYCPPGKALRVAEHTFYLEVGGEMFKNRGGFESYLFGVDIAMEVVDNDEAVQPIFKSRTPTTPPRCNWLKATTQACNVIPENRSYATDCESLQVQASTGIQMFKMETELAKDYMDGALGADNLTRRPLDLSRAGAERDADRLRDAVKRHLEEHP